MYIYDSKVMVKLMSFRSPIYRPFQTKFRSAICKRLHLKAVSGAMWVPAVKVFHSKKQFEVHEMLLEIAFIITTPIVEDFTVRFTNCKTEVYSGPPLPFLPGPGPFVTFYSSRAI